MLANNCLLQIKLNKQTRMPKIAYIMSFGKALLEVYNIPTIGSHRKTKIFFR